MRDADVTSQTELDDLGEPSFATLLRCPSRLGIRQARTQGPEDVAQLCGRVVVALCSGEVLASEGKAIAGRELHFGKQALLSTSASHDLARVSSVATDWNRACAIVPLATRQQLSTWRHTGSRQQRADACTRQT